MRFHGSRRWCGEFDFHDRRCERKVTYAWDCGRGVVRYFCAGHGMGQRWALYRLDLARGTERDAAWDYARSRIVRLFPMEFTATL